MSGQRCASTGPICWVQAIAAVLLLAICLWAPHIHRLTSPLNERGALSWSAPRVQSGGQATATTTFDADGDGLPDTVRPEHLRVAHDLPYLVSVVHDVDIHFVSLHLSPLPPPPRV
jgi:hypothetical protein